MTINTRFTNNSKCNRIMKRNYIAPSTEMQTWASMGLMQDPIIGFAAASNGTSTVDYDQID